MSTWNDENRWYARLMKLAHELAMEGRPRHAPGQAAAPWCLAWNEVLGFTGAEAKE